MGLFAQAVRTYDWLQDNNIKGPAPLFHKAVRIDIKVELKEDGTLLGIYPFSKEDAETGYMPVTEESGGRSGTTIAPHPLIEDIKNLTLEENAKAYLAQLKEWCNAEPKNIAINAVYKYLSKGTLSEDLKKEGIPLMVKEKEDKKGKKDEKDEENAKEKPSKQIIGWAVETSSGLIKTWDNEKLVESFINYTTQKLQGTKSVFCMVSGKEEVPIENIPKLPKIAKLISSNDSQDFSYRGRFVTSEEALTTGYITMQKAINTLAWLLNNDEYCLSLRGNSQLICWRPEGLTVQKPDTLFLAENNPQFTFPGYKKMLEERINNEISEVPVEKRGVVVAILNATSTGRGSIKYYNEFSLEEFLSGLMVWDLECCWTNYKGINSPHLYRLAVAAYGAFDRKEGFKAGNKNPALENMYSTLLTRRINDGKIPVELVNNLVARCEKLPVYIGTDADKEKNAVQNLLFVTCAALRKYYIDNGVKEYNMTLDKGLKDRSYQWGRLLAIYEKIEKDALSGEKDVDKAETNATRMISTFIRRPAYTAKILEQKMRVAYFPRLTANKTGFRIKHEKDIQEIMQILSEFPENEFNKPLKPSYLFGYYLQKASYYTKSDKADE